MQVLIVLAFAAVLLVPFFARRSEQSTSGLAPADPKTAARLIVVTPHIEQIRVEFADGFDRWHRRVHGQPVIVDYRAPGGTTEILKLLEAMYAAAMQRQIAAAIVKNPDALMDPAMRLDVMPAGETDFDMMFGGGTFDHDRLRSRGVTVASALPRSAGTKKVTLSRPRDMPTAARLPELRTIETKATFDGKTLVLRIPIGAITGGVAMIAPLAGDARDVSCEVDLTRCERVFNVRISAPPEPMFTDDEMAAVFGKENRAGTGQVWQDDSKVTPGDKQHWIGTALSGFGIVFNRPLHAEHHLSTPSGWADLRRPQYAGKLALADARLSGSVATLYDSILNSQGFDEGFATLRDMCANARTFAAASTTPPMDVSQGDAMAGVAIDFYGRFQAQAIMRPGENPETSRMGYVDPPGAVYVDADPVSVLRGGPNPTIARRFIEFCLTEEAQALWQLPALADKAGSAKNPVIAGDSSGRRMGPDHFVLRRMPVRQSMYRPEMFALFADRTNLYEIASNVPTKGWRDGMIMMMGCFGIDTAQDLRSAWAALNRAKANSAFPREVLAKMTEAFYAMPEHELADGTRLVFNEKNYAAIARDCNRWRDQRRGPLAKIAYVEFFRGQYAKVLELERSALGAQ